MPCKHAEDVCQRCLEKVLTTPAERSVRIKQIKAKIDENRKEIDRIQSQIDKIHDLEKANQIFFAFSLLALAGYVSFWQAKFLWETAGFGVVFAKSIFRNLVD